MLHSDTLSKKKIKNENELGKLNCEGPERPFRDLVLTLKLKPIKNFKHRVTKSGFFFLSFQRKRYRHRNR